jgi:cytochrome o ubiquinol oxidase operon protein cyoD
MSTYLKLPESDGELAPGDERSEDSGRSSGIRGYLIGFMLAAGLTFASFGIIQTDLIWPPGLPIALAVFAVAQIGVHLVFFLHINSGPDNTNNILALAFGILIVSIVIAGSLWIMHHLNTNMTSMPGMENLQTQR